MANRSNSIISKRRNWGGANGGTGGISIDSIAYYLMDTIGGNRKQARLIVKTVLNSIKDVLHTGNKVVIPGFGTFYSHKRDRLYCNFKRGQRIPLEKVTVKFRPSLTLRKHLAKERHGRH